MNSKQKNTWRWIKKNMSKLMKCPQVLRILWNYQMKRYIYIERDICVCVYMCVCVCVYIYAHKHTCVCVYTYIDTHRLLEGHNAAPRAQGKKKRKKECGALGSRLPLKIIETKFFLLLILLLYVSYPTVSWRDIYQYSSSESVCCISRAAPCRWSLLIVTWRPVPRGGSLD